MTTAEALKNRIGDIVLPALRPYVARIFLCGSTARGEADTDSDADLLITLRPPAERPRSACGDSNPSRT